MGVAMKHKKGPTPSETCRRGAHTICKGTRQFGHGMKARCSCECHKAKKQEVSVKTFFGRVPWCVPREYDEEREYEQGAALEAPDGWSD